MERCGAQGVSFVVSIILARLLAPEVYGTIALVTVFTAIMQVFVDSGLGTALIQSKDADERDFSTVFYFNIVFSAVLYAVMFFAAPLIANIYDNQLLVPVVRVLSLTLLVSGVRNVQQAYVSRNMQFKKFFLVTLVATVVSAVVGITMAYFGLGVWALVGQQLTNAVVSTAILWITVRWRPKLMFSFSRLGVLFKYGWKLLVSSLIDTVYNDLRTLVIGTMYTESDLAFYNKGQQFPQFIVSNINSSIDSVLLPTLSSAQEDRDAMKKMTRRAIKTSTYILMPMMMGLAVCAEPIVYYILGEQWMSCVPFLRIFCFSFAFYPIHTANLNAIKAMGKSGVFLVLEIVKKVVGVVLLLASMWFGVMAIAYTLIISTVLSQIINAWPNKKLLGYSYLEQLKDMLPSILLSLVMGAAVYAVGFANLPMWGILLIQIPLGVAIYVGLSALFKVEIFRYLVGVIKKFLPKKRDNNEA